jgi:mono/diheme cytochrome c family protein
MNQPLAWVLPTQLAEARLMAGSPSQAARVYLYAPGVDCAGCHAGPDMELVNLSDTKKLDPLAGAQVLGLEH